MQEEVIACKHCIDDESIDEPWWLTIQTEYPDGEVQTVKCDEHGHLDEDEWTVVEV